MRRARIKADGAGYYHGVSRIIERRMILGEVEKERFLKLMRNLAAFGGLTILSYCLMTNHFHILLYVPQREDVSDETLLQRLRHILSAAEVDFIARQLQEYRSRQGQDMAADSLKVRFTYRMYDLSEFFKALKQQFSQFYNAKNDRRGPLWEERFKSVLVEAASETLLTMAAYIDLNPVRAGMVQDPKDYRYSSYGAALGGSPDARQGLQDLIHLTGEHSQPTWDQAQRTYRQRLYAAGSQKGVDAQGRPIRQGFTRDQIEKVVQEGGRLPLHDILRCRVRYFTDGLAVGRQEFVESVFVRYRGQFGAKRKTGARPLRFGEWDDVCSLRDLRLQVVSCGEGPFS